MLDLVLRVLMGWTALSCLTAVGWSVLVTRYRRALRGAAPEVAPFPAANNRKAA